MIELRWGFNHPITGKRGIVIGGEYELVLQYREVESPSDHLPDWQDVPIVGIVRPQIEKKSSP